MLFTVFQGTDFSLQNIQTEINFIHGRLRKTSQWSSHNFCLPKLPKNHEVKCYPDLIFYFSLNCWCFLLISVFSWFNWNSICLNQLILRKELGEEESLSYTQNQLWMKTKLSSDSFQLSYNLLYFIYSLTINFLKWTDVVFRWQILHAKYKFSSFILTCVEATKQGD